MGSKGFVTFILEGNSLLSGHGGKDRWSLVARKTS